MKLKCIMSNMYFLQVRYITNTQHFVFVLLVSIIFLIKYLPHITSYCLLPKLPGLTLYVLLIH